MKVRQSNFELLRLVAIFGIIIHHLLINDMDVCGYNKPWFLDQGWQGLFVNSLVVGGVNLFVLISGWFGIRSIWKNVAKLLIDCVVYGVIALSIYSIIMQELPDFRLVYESIRVTRYWFVVHFIILILISPIIEKSLVGISVKEIRNWVVILTIINVFMGYFLGLVNKNGYNVVQFVYLYYMGRWLRLCFPDKWYKQLSKYAIVIWLLCACVETSLYVLASNRGIHIEGMRYWGYNSPLVLISSVLMFMWFSFLKVHSRIINLMATGVLGTYILHSGMPLGKIRGALTLRLFEEYGYWGVFLTALLIFIVCIIIASITEPLIMKSLNKVWLQK